MVNGSSQVPMTVISIRLGCSCYGIEGMFQHVPSDLSTCRSNSCRLQNMNVSVEYEKGFRVTLKINSHQGLSRKWI